MASSTSQAMPAIATAAFNPAEVSTADAELWCQAQLKSCPEICGGTASTNSCNAASFTYTCICTNGSTPDCTAYTNTLPYFICLETFSQCISAHPNDAQGQEVCANNEQCGTKDPSSVAKSSGSSSSSVTSVSSLSSVKSVSSSSSVTSVSSTTSIKSSISTKPTSTTTSSSVSSATSKPSSSSLSIGAAAGIGVGCTLAFLGLVGLILFFFMRRHRRMRSVAPEQANSATIPMSSEKPSKAELYGDLAKYPNSGQWSADIADKPEMITNANRHEMENTQVAATLDRPWSADLPELPEQRHM